MAVWFAWRWNGKPYASDPTRRMRLAPSTILRLYYQWKKGSRSLAAIELHYRGPQKLPSRDVLALARLCLAPGTRSFTDAWRQVPNPPATYNAYWHAMPGDLRKLFSALFATRRHVEYLQRRAQEAVKKVVAGLSHPTQ
jgi:hypothetical protein